MKRIISSSEWPGSCLETLSQLLALRAWEETQATRLSSPGEGPWIQTLSFILDRKREMRKDLPALSPLLASATPCVTDNRASEPLEMTAHRVQCKLGPDIPGPTAIPARLWELYVLEGFLSSHPFQPMSGCKCQSWEACEAMGGGGGASP